ncbi:MAG: helix-hairpin-helix domain-containing protein [candidate division WOR-3 bacterium]|nr:helix-hairpin-helix domain-containing protein [candidate division WOR-3 bacterium]MDW7987417.1 hypothetical protein [candidate division WOR-3 bacterium]
MVRRVIFILASLFYLASSEPIELFDQTINLPEELFLLDNLQDLTECPLDLNKLSASELTQLVFLTPIAQYEIIRHQRFKNLNELLTLKSIDSSLYCKITPYLTVKESPKSIGHTKIYLRTESIGNWKNNYKTVLTNNFSYECAAIKIRSFLRFQKQLNLLRSQNQSQANFLFSNRKIQFLLGNYELLSPGGVIFSGNLEYFNPLKDFTNLMPHISTLSSVSNSKNLLGIFVQSNFNNVVASGFMGQNFHNAQVQNGTVKQVYLTSQANLLDTFYRLSEGILGAELKLLYGGQNFLGLNFCHLRYALPIVPNDSTNSFYGSQLNLLGVSNVLYLNNYFLVSEFGYSVNWGYGLSTRLIGDWRKLKVNFNFYFQKKNFFAPYSRWPALHRKHNRAFAQFNLSYKFADFLGALSLRSNNFYEHETIPPDFRVQLEHETAKHKVILWVKNNFSESQLIDYSTGLDFKLKVSEYLSLSYQYQDRSVPNNGHCYLFAVSTILKLNRLKTELRTYYFYTTSSKIKLYMYEAPRNSITFNNTQLRIRSNIELKIVKNLSVNYYLAFSKVLSIAQLNFETGILGSLSYLNFIP